MAEIPETENYFATALIFRFESIMGHTYIGQGQRAVCGKGYSCFYSGFNYQCCPTAADEDPQSPGSCPLGSYTVTDSDAEALKCDHKQQCPKVFKSIRPLHRIRFYVESSGKHVLQHTQSHTNLL